jgi:hypothetical protein
MSLKLTASKLAGVKYHSRNMLQFSYKAGKPITSTEARALLRNNKTLIDKDTYATNNNTQVEFLVTAYFPFGPRSSSWHTLEELQLYMVPEYWLDEHGVPTIDHITVYMRKTGNAIGGSSTDEKNDCFYNCLKKAYGDEIDLIPKQIRTAGKLKKYLGLKRTDKVPIDKLYIIEDIFNLSFTINGDHKYISKKLKPQNINLSLTNEHYKLKCNENRSKTDGVYFKEVSSESVIIYRIKYGEYVETYDGIELKSPSIEDFLEDKNKYEHLYVKVKLSEDLIEYRKKYIKNADLLKEATNGFINLYKYDKIPLLAYDIWRQKSKNVIEPEEIGVLEAEYLDKSFRGGTHYSNNSYEGMGYCYDVNSMYLHIMSSLNFQIPMKKGEFRYISQKEFSELKFYQFGIYRCKITSEHPYVKKDRSNYYTQYDLILFKELGITYEIIDDGQTNCIIYEKDRINGNKMFGAFANYMYELKKDGLPVKEIISCLWGYLAKKRKIYHKGTSENQFVIDDSNIVIDAIYEVGNETKVKVTDFKNLFMTNYARIGTFLTSYARLHICRIAKKHEANTLCINTDSIVSSKDLSNDITIGVDLGQFKIEYESNIRINNCNSIECQCSKCNEWMKTKLFKKHRCTI